jgi:hypothetical protein
MKAVGGIVTIVSLAWLTTFVQAAENSKTTKTHSPGTYRVTASQNFLSVEASDGPLLKILQEIGKQAQVRIESNIGPEERITVRLDRVPLEEGIKQLAKNVTVFYAESPKDKTLRIEKIVVLSEGMGVSRPVTVSPPPVKKNERPPGPEPFKFEFDPTKFGAPQKQGKQP